MKKYLGTVALLFLSVAVAGCQSDEARKTDMLAAAGFRVRLADTPAKAAAIKNIPPNQFLIATLKGSGRNVYVYSDPAGCNCVYFGGKRAYEAYQRLADAQGAADRNLLIATMEQDEAGTWGLWGGPGWREFY